MNEKSPLRAKGAFFGTYARGRASAGYFLAGFSPLTTPPIFSQVPLGT